MCAWVCVCSWRVCDGGSGFLRAYGTTLCLYYKLQGENQLQEFLPVGILLFARWLLSFLKCKLPSDDSKGVLCPTSAESGHGWMHASVCTSARVLWCFGVCVCVCACLSYDSVIFGIMVLGPRWAGLILNQTHTDGLSHHTHTHTHASTLTRIHTIPSRTSSVSRVLHRDGLTVILPFKATHPEYTQIRPMIVLACIIKQDGWTIQHQRTFGPVKTLISPPWPQMIRILYDWDTNLLSCFQ